MVWARIDDEILDNAKVLSAGLIAFALHVGAITWANRNLTDGFIPVAAARRLFDFGGVRHEFIGYHSGPPAPLDRVAQALDGIPEIRAEDIAARLVECRLWEVVDGGWMIHDFDKYNPTRAEVEAQRTAKSGAGREGARRRWGDTSKAPTMATAMGGAMGPAMGPAMGGAMGPAMGGAMGGAMGPPMAERWQNDAPDPDPRREEDQGGALSLSQDHKPRARAYEASGGLTAEELVSLRDAEASARSRLPSASPPQSLKKIRSGR